MKKFIRVISPISLAVMLAFDIGIIFFANYAVQKIMQGVDIWTILFLIIILLSICLALAISKEILTNGVRFDEEKVEFTGLDENNVFQYRDIKNVEAQRDTKASLKKNFVDRYSHIILYLNDDSVVTIDLGLTTAKALNKIEVEIKNRI